MGEDFRSGHLALLDEAPERVKPGFHKRVNGPLVGLTTVQGSSTCWPRRSFERHILMTDLAGSAPRAPGPGNRDAKRVLPGSRPPGVVLAHGASRSPKSDKAEPEVPQAALRAPMSAPEPKYQSQKTSDEVPTSVQAERRSVGLLRDNTPTRSVDQAAQDPVGEIVPALAETLPAALASHPGEHGVWRLYRIKRREDGKAYIGVTCRDVGARFRAHCADALRDNGARGRPGTITNAIREAIRRGLDPATAFQVLELAYYTDPEATRRAEVNWIKVLGTAQPRGFNYMPGGASLGSVANAKPVELHHPIRGRLSLATISAAIVMRNAELAQEGRPKLLGSLVYWRIAAKWSLAEALGYNQRADGRGLRRRTVRCRGRRMRSLREASVATGVSAEALRSRVHRARRAGLRQADIARDRRRSGAKRAATILASLPDPRNSAAPALSTGQFAAATGLSKSTVIHRRARLRVIGQNPAMMPRHELLAFMNRRVERRIFVKLFLPDGRVLRGGVRELVRKVLGEPSLKWRRDEHIGASAIRARLRQLPGWRLRGFLDPKHLLWAFGFQVGSAPGPQRPVGDAGPHNDPWAAHLDVSCKRSGVNGDVVKASGVGLQSSQLPSGKRVSHADDC